MVGRAKSWRSSGASILQLYRLIKLDIQFFPAEAGFSDHLLFIKSNLNTKSQG
jgi:hypothetical protein